MAQGGLARPAITCLKRADASCASSTQFQLDIYRTASAAGWLPWLLLTVVVVTPIGEEMLFRGFLFRGWHRSPRDVWPVIVVTALLWAVARMASLG